jgi:hypothetical protein
MIVLRITVELLLLCPHLCARLFPSASSKQQVPMAALRTKPVHVSPTEARVIICTNKTNLYSSITCELPASRVVVMVMQCETILGI